MKKIIIPVPTKVILIIAAIACAVSGFAPWFDYGRTENMGQMAYIYLACGGVVAILSIIALVTKTKLFNTLSNVFGVIGSLIASFYTVMFVIGANNLKVTQYFGWGFWMGAISCVAMITLTIISAIQTKRRNK